uniref:(northern house mosquito) hypothetical protein n=1 Tax=Culex pipiens TaxID=7175 RepID=A0A8D8GTM3_CULPI
MLRDLRMRCANQGREQLDVVTNRSRCNRCTVAAAVATRVGAAVAAPAAKRPKPCCAGCPGSSRTRCTPRTRAAAGTTTKCRVRSAQGFHCCSGCGSSRRNKSVTVERRTLH